MNVDPTKLSTSIERNFIQFKDIIIERLMNGDSSNDVSQFIREYSFPELTQEDYTKRKRVKNVIPFHEKCIAKRGDGEQCSRRKKKGGEFCGTHTKACPHGVIKVPTEETEKDENGKPIVRKQIEVWLEDITGIMYWINENGTVYHPDDISKNVENPRIIAHYEKNQVNGKDVYNIIGEIH